MRNNKLLTYNRAGAQRVYTPKPPPPPSFISSYVIATHNSLLQMLLIVFIVSTTLITPHVTQDIVPQNALRNSFNTRQLLTSDVKSLLSEGYHNTTEKLSAAINRLIQKYPELTESFILGNSVDKNPLLGIKISSSKLSKLPEKRPAVAFLGGIHGDHALGHEIVLYLAAFLLESYKQDETRIKNLISTVDVMLIPTLNPDGFYAATHGDCYSAKALSGRVNKNGVDLDADFTFHNYKDLSAVQENNKLQPETKSFLNWIVGDGKSVQLFATLRTGLTGITYPYDETPDQITEHTYGILGALTAPNQAPDHLFFEHLGHEVYYKFQDEPTKSQCNPLNSDEFVLNGARVGSTYGALSDFLYRFTNIFPLNIYLDCCKYPKDESLESKWLQHANSLVALLGGIELGLRGTVLDRISSKPIPGAIVAVNDIARNITTDADGKYWRPLAPSQLVEMTVESDGYKPIVRSHIVQSTNSSPNKSNILNFRLVPLSAQPTSTIDDEHSSSNTQTTVMSSSKFKPEYLYGDIDEQIGKLDFETPTELQKHHTFNEMVAILQDFTKRFPKLTRLYDIGESSQGRKLWVLEISDKPGFHQILKPEFRYIANIHGNEVVGRELLLNLAKLILENYGSNDLITSIVNSTRIHLLPSMNPDGYENSSEGDCDSEVGRPNANNFDLNRNFPDRFGETKDNKDTQPEVKAVMKWSHEYPFVLGANLHGGSVVANYPFDGNLQNRNGKYDASPDDQLFIHLAKTYSTNHPTMSKGEHCFDICGDNRASLLNERFTDGITNGAQWYVLYGGIQDWVYLNTNCMSITVELGCKKYPVAQDMPRYWSDNKKPLIKYLLEVHRGIYGVVTDQNNRPLANATIHVKGVNHDVHSADGGDYWRLLLPGYYAISVSRQGYRTAHRTVSVGKYGSPAKRVDFSLISGPKDLSNNDINGVAPELDQYSDKHSNYSELVKTDEPSGEQSTLGSRDSDDTHTNNTLSSLLKMDESRQPVEPGNSKQTLALCFVIVLPSIMLIVYLFGSTKGKRYPSRLGFYRLATSAPDEADDDDDEGARFMRGSKMNRAINDQASDSEDELYSADNWNK